MKALITGASTGFGRDFAIKLSKEGYDIVAVARSKEKLEELKKEIDTNLEIEVMDLSDKKNAYKLHEKYSGQIDLLVNNAGFGECGRFDKTDLDIELNMIDLNIISLHILTKLFYTEFVEKDKGQILNVASIAAFQPGPLMETYYASKAYVYNLTMALYEENRRNKGNVKISVLCPGPAETGFFSRANVKFAIKPVSSDYVTDYALKKLKKNKLLIIPGFIPKATVWANRFLLTRKGSMKVVYSITKRKLYGKNK